MRYSTFLIISLLAALQPTVAKADFVFIDEEPVAEPIEAQVLPAAAVVDPPLPAPSSVSVSKPPLTPTPIPTAEPEQAPPPTATAAVVPPPPPPATQAVVAAVAVPLPTPVAEPIVVEDVQLSTLSTPPRGASVLTVVSTMITSVPSHGATLDVRAGETVRTAFERWTTDAGWTLRWQADFDLRIEADNLYSSDQLTEVVPEVLAAFRAPPGQKRLTATAYRGNRVLLIEGRVQQ